MNAKLKSIQTALSQTEQVLSDIAALETEQAQTLVKIETLTEKVGEGDAASVNALMVAKIQSENVLPAKKQKLEETCRGSSSFT